MQRYIIIFANLAPSQGLVTRYLTWPQSIKSCGVRAHVLISSLRFHCYNRRVRVTLNAWNKCFFLYCFSRQCDWSWLLTIKKGQSRSVTKCPLSLDMMSKLIINYRHETRNVMQPRSLRHYRNFSKFEEVDWFVLLRLAGTFLGQVELFL